MNADEFLDRFTDIKMGFLGGEYSIEEMDRLIKELQKEYHPYKHDHPWTDPADSRWGHKVQST